MRESRRTALAVAQAAGTVPECVVHGDVWARNAVQAGPDGPVTLIDWETGGLGLAILDLGNCLMECHLDAAVPDTEPEAWLISPDEDRIAAVARGYSSVRALSAAELDLLPDGCQVRGRGGGSGAPGAGAGRRRHGSDHGRPAGPDREPAGGRR